VLGLLSVSASGIIGGVNDAIVKARYFPDEADNTQAVLGGVLVSCLLVGAFVGCFLGVDFSNRFGRRVSFRITAINCIVMSVLLAVLPGFPLLIITRTLLGKYPLQHALRANQWG
jgi:MFS family permease